MAADKTIQDYIDEIDDLKGQVSTLEKDLKEVQNDRDTYMVALEDIKEITNKYV